MAVNLWETGSSNAFQTTLNGGISASDETIALTTTSGLTAPGVLVLDRQDGSGNDTPTNREFITFTGISSNDITGCTRGVAGSTAQSHNSGALVEETFTTTHWGDMLDYLRVSHDDSGNIVVSSTATISTIRVHSYLNASGASITGRFPIHPGWVVGGLVSLATTSVGKPLPMPQAGEFKWFSMTLRAPASGSSMVIDINKNGVSIFDAANRLTIPINGTFASTASIATKTFAQGDFMSMDIDVGGGLGSDLTVLGRAE